MLAGGGAQLQEIHAAELISYWRALLSCPSPSLTLQRWLAAERNYRSFTSPPVPINLADLQAGWLE